MTQQTAPEARGFSISKFTERQIICYLCSGKFEGGKRGKKQKRKKKWRLSVNFPAAAAAEMICGLPL